MESSASLSTFIMGLASAVLIDLGLVEDPTTKKKRKQLDRARLHIELLQTLQVKTRGNLDEEEKILIERVLTDLRLQYVKVSEEKKS